MEEVISPVTLSQFKGTLAGVLVGDCLGYPYENECSSACSVSKIHEDISQVVEGTFKGEKVYSDDTSMTVTVTRFLTDGKVGDYPELARRFYRAKQSEAHPRAYGSHVHTVFYKLVATDFADPFTPAAEQFNGGGSLGNGGGMRVAPIALYTIKDNNLDRLIDLTTCITRITHTHPQGIAGGIFQALGVRTALLFGAAKAKGESKGRALALQILDAFEKDFKSAVANNPTFNIGTAYGVYRDRLKSIRGFIEAGPSSWTFEEINRVLGVKVTAAESIPTGLFCFLAAFEPIPNIETDNQFQRTVELAIALGGDTDTVAAMAGSIAGAYLGFDDEINQNLVKVCEDYQGVLSSAERLYHALHA